MTAFFNFFFFSVDVLSLSVDNIAGASYMYYTKLEVDVSAVKYAITHTLILQST